MYIGYWTLNKYYYYYDSFEYCLKIVKYKLKTYFNRSLYDSFGCYLKIVKYILKRILIQVYLSN